MLRQPLLLLPAQAQVAAVLVDQWLLLLVAKLVQNMVALAAAGLLTLLYHLAPVVHLYMAVLAEELEVQELLRLLQLYQVQAVTLVCIQ
jgi:hypothetical protein